MRANRQQDTDTLLKKIKSEISKDFENESTGHDIEHLERVLTNAKKIQQKEGGARDVILIAALVHDIHRIMKPPVEHPTAVGVSPAESLGKVDEILKRCKVPEDLIPPILEVVKKHDDRDNEELNQETKIVQDADMLDAIGKQGLKRTLQYCKHKHIPVTNTAYPLDTEEYVPDYNPISTCHYIYRTMIPCKNQMHTQTGKDMSKTQIKILEDFIKDNLPQTPTGAILNP